MKICQKLMSAWQRRLERYVRPQKKYVGNFDPPVGVTLNYGFIPTIKFKSGCILPGNLDRYLYPEYYKNSPDGWPRDPVTGEKMPVA
jgi:hypothetical protein